MREAIICMYTCHACALTKVKLAVPAREDEDVRVWMDATAAMLGADHCRRSPHCMERKIDLYIPMSGADKIGGPTKQVTN